MASHIRRLRRLIRNFRNAQNGNVAIIFTIALIPLLGLVGGAIDYSRASAARTAMQAALDATALAMSKEAASLTPGQLNEKAAAYFAAAFNQPDVSGIKLEASQTTGSSGPSVTVTASGAVDAKFLGIMGIDTIPIGSSAKTAWGSAKLRIAFVLDNSGSMGSGGRMTALKAATKNLLTKLKNASTSPGDVQVAIVPFNKYVNAGSGSASAPWVDWSEWDNVNGKCSDDDYKTKSKCESKKKTWTAKSHNDWNGCVTDRDHPYDVQNTTPDTSNSKTLFPAVQGSPCPTTVVPMGYDWASLNTKVESMVSDGYTNQPIGLVWGWHALTEGAPLSSPPIADKKNTEKYVILLSDGENTQNRWHDGWGAEAAINARQKLVCDNIKAAGIQIYSVLLIDGNESVMKDCASKPDMFFKLDAANQVISAFDAIGTNLTKLRLAQ